MPRRYSFSSAHTDRPAVNHASRNIAGCNGSNPGGACRILDLDFALDTPPFREAEPIAQRSGATAWRRVESRIHSDVDSADVTMFDALPQGLARHPGLTSTGVEQSFAHQGLLLEPEIRTLQSRRRQYNPVSRRYLQTDPVGYGDGLNLFQALHANPYRFLDPMGTTGVSIDFAPDRITIRAKIAFWGCGLTGACDGDPPDDHRPPKLPRGEFSFLSTLAPWADSQHYLFPPLFSGVSKRRVVFDFTGSAELHSLMHGSTPCDDPSVAATPWGDPCAEEAIRAVVGGISVWLRATQRGIDVAPPKEGSGGGSADVLGPSASGQRVEVATSWARDYPELRLVAHELGHIFGIHSHPFS
jgi:RHS repeat-associated protein